MARAARSLLLLVCVQVACAREMRVPPPPPLRTAEQAQSPELVEAIARWHDEDDLEPLRRFVRRHPNDVEAELWREVVALHSYDACTGESGDDETGLRGIVREYPDTLAGRVAMLELVGDRLDTLYAAVPGTLVTDFLEGGDAWARAGDGSTIAGLDLAAIRDAHGGALRNALGQAIVADHCNETMGYCSWWVARYPSDALTATVKAEITQTWYRRGHPHWRGGKHARCAFRCMRECRERARPLDDTCYAPCYSRC
jgi:hypothetical protein